VVRGGRLEHLDPGLPGKRRITLDGKSGTGFKMILSRTSDS
jgi:hypothetical protein